MRQAEVNLLCFPFFGESTNGVNEDQEIDWRLIPSAVEAWACVGNNLAIALVFFLN